MGKAVDDVIDEVVKPACGAIIHKVPDDVAAVLRRARERVDSGETISYSGLSRVITREFDVAVDQMSIRNFLKGRGCRCG